MKITLEFDNLREMQKVIDQLFILFPEDLNPEGGGTEKTESAGEVAKRLRVDHDEILRMKAEGMTARAIAQATGNGYSTVCRVIQEARKK